MSAQEQPNSHSGAALGPVYEENGEFGGTLDRSTRELAFFTFFATLAAFLSCLVFLDICCVLARLL